MKKFLLLFSFFGCAHKPSTQKIKIIRFDDMPVVTTSPAGQAIKLGGFSALSFVKKENATLHFETITDRGPNAEKRKSLRPFLNEDYSPQLVSFTVDTDAGKAKIHSTNSFKNADGKSVSGLPPINADNTEVPVDVFGKKIIHKNPGMDSEGFCRVKNKVLVSDEYGPDVLVFSSELKLERKLVPGAGLPAAFATRELNRGLEALASDGEKVYVMLQSPLPAEKNLVRLVQLKAESFEVEGEFLYPVDKADKIGDLGFVAARKFLVLEQNGKIGPKGIRRVYEVDLATAGTGGLLKKTLVADLTALGFDFMEKIEGIAAIDEHSFAVITDNDFGIEGDPDKDGIVPVKKDPFTYMAIVSY